MKIVATSPSFAGLEMEREIFSKINADVVICPEPTEEVIMSLARDADALLVDYPPIRKRLIDSLQRCKIISVASIGYDNVDVVAAKEAGILVTHVPGYCIEEVSDHTMALILACARDLFKLERNARNRRYISDTNPVRLSGKTLGLIGLGSIGCRVTEKAKGFTLRIIAYDPYLPKVKWPGFVEDVSLPDLLAQSDFISVHTPLTQATAGLLSRNEFGQMKKSAYVINTSRGGVIDEDALVEALENEAIAGAALDVCVKEPISEHHRLLDLDNVIITPHAAYYSADSVREVRVRAAEQVVMALTGKPVTGVVRV